MKKKKQLLFVALLSVLSASFASAEEKSIKLGTGSATGNYFSIAKDIKSYCDEDVEGASLEILESGGSVSNLLGMQNKQYSIGIIQEDVLNHYAKKNPRKVNGNKLKIISGLHTESIHLLFPIGYKPKSSKEASIFDYFNDDNLDVPKKISLSSLKDQTIGSWGGSILSAEALSDVFSLNINVVDVPKDKRNPSSKVVPLLLVGGYPYPIVDEYLKTNQWILVSLDYAEISKVKSAGYYSQESVSYAVKGKMQSTSTIGVRALLVGKSFRKESRNKTMSEIATCLDYNVEDLADDPDTSPLWSSIYDFIEDNDQVNWPYFPLIEDKDL